MTAAKRFTNMAMGSSMGPGTSLLHDQLLLSTSIQTAGWLPGARKKRSTFRAATQSARLFDGLSGG